MPEERQRSGNKEGEPMRLGKESATLERAQQMDEQQARAILIGGDVFSPGEHGFYRG